MAFPAFLDTNVLFGAVLNDTLLRVAEAGAFGPHGSAEILEELSRNLTRHAGLTLAQAQRRTGQMSEAFPDALISGYEGLVGDLDCHPKDRHVLAAAIKGRCEVLVTFNLKDFPPASVREFDITVSHPQDFLLDQLDLHPRLVQQALRVQSASARNPSLTHPQLLSRLRRAGVGDFVDELAHRFGESGDTGLPQGRRFHQS